MAKLVHLEITADTVGPIAEFYAKILGWPGEPSPFVPDYTVLDGPDGTSGAVMSNRYQAQAVIPWFEVPDIEAALAEVTAAGGAQAGEINTIPGQGRVVYATDPGGTVFGFKQPE